MRNSEVGYLNTMLQEVEQVICSAAQWEEKIEKILARSKRFDYSNFYFAGNDNKTLYPLEKIFRLLMDAIKTEEVYDKTSKLAWCFRGFFGDDPNNFYPLKMSDDDCDFLAQKLRIIDYQNCGMTVIASYSPHPQKERFASLLIDYADKSKGKEMNWAMCGDACESLAFLKANQLESIDCLFRHIDDGGCDGYPHDQCVFALRYFPEHHDKIATTLLKFINSEIENDWGSLDDVCTRVEFFKTLMLHIKTKQQARYAIDVIKRYVKLSYKGSSFDIAKEIRKDLSSSLHVDGMQLFQTYNFELLVLGYLNILAE